MKISMSEQANPYENAVAERINGILKQEFMLDIRFPDFETARKWAAAALDIVRSDETPGYVRDHWQSELDHRLSRLDGKINKHPVKGKGD